MAAESFGVLPKGYKLLEYEFQGILGQGGFGVTYLALDLNLNKKVAICLGIVLVKNIKIECLRPPGHWGVTRFGIRSVSDRASAF